MKKTYLYEKREGLKQIEKFHIENKKIISDVTSVRMNIFYKKIISDVTSVRMNIFY
jgi:hypothetical protein